MKGEDRFLKSTDARAYRAIVLLHSYSPPPRETRGGGAVRICSVAARESAEQREESSGVFGKRWGRGLKKIGQFDFFGEDYLVGLVFFLALRAKAMKP